MERERLLRGAVVKIRQSGGSSHLGTGFFVSSRSIVSCAHVTQKAKGKPLEVVPYGREPLPVGIDFESGDCEALDLAILKLTDGAIWSGDTLPLHPECETGDELYACGFPSNKPQGDVETFEAIGRDGEGLLKFKEGLATSGFSGSPLWNLRTQKVCGVVIISLDERIDLGGRALVVDRVWEVRPELKPVVAQPNPFVPLQDPLEPAALFGREEELERVFNRLNSGGSVAIIGEVKAGKTSLLKAIAAQAEQRLSIRRQCIHLNLADMFGDRDFYEALCDEMGISPAVYGGYKFKKQAREKRVLLLLDGLQEMQHGWLTQQVRSQLRALASDIDAQAKDNQPIFRLVVAAHKPLKQLFTAAGMDSPFEEICLEISLKLWEEAAIRGFIRQRLAKTGIVFAEEQVREIIASSDGSPKTIMGLCHQVYEDLQG